MEVEITGTPEPTVTWYKDNIPIAQALQSGYKVKTVGNSHTLVIEKGAYITPRNTLFTYVHRFFSLQLIFASVEDLWLKLQIQVAKHKALLILQFTNPLQTQWLKS